MRDALVLVLGVWAVFVVMAVILLAQLVKRGGAGVRDALVLVLGVWAVFVVMAVILLAQLVK